MTKDDFIKSTPSMKILVSGPFGSGKSTFGMTFPGVYYIGTEPGGLEILRTEQGKPLLDNLVEYEYCYPDPLAGRADLRKLVEEPDNVNPGGLLYQALDRAQKLGKEGKVQTLFLDNLTYVSELFWQYLERYKSGEFTTEKGAVNKLQMYGALSRWLFRFVLTRVIPFPGYVVVSCHLKDESSEKMEQKKQKDVSTVPNLLGGFRDTAEGLFTASLYLERKLIVKKDPATAKTSYESLYYCYCQNQVVAGFGSKILAKNRHGLPPVMMNASYAEIMKSIKVKPQQAVLEEVKS